MVDILIKFALLYKTFGGYLKVYNDSYRDCFRESWKNSNNKVKELKLLKSLPNFDAGIFEEISGLGMVEMEDGCK